MKMKILRLSDLIGQEIVELKFHYVPENEYGLQSFHSYIKLASDTIIDIPKFDDDDYLQLTHENLEYFRKMFDSGKSVNDKVKTYFAGQQIADIYFSYYNGEIEADHSAFIKLSNGYYLTENNSGPVGLTDIDLIILDEENFSKEVKRLSDIEVDVRPFARRTGNPI
jgi:hypothetical protein